MNGLAWRLLGACATCLSLALAGCATWQAPRDTGDAALRSRAVTEARRDVRLSAAVLGAADARHVLGGDFDKIRVQPVWIEVRNGTSQPLWLLRSGTDPDYYSALEVAWLLHTPFGGGANTRIDSFFDSLAFKNPIAPGTARAGFLFTNPERGSKLLNVDLLGRRTLISFSLFLQVPDDALDNGSVLFRYSDAQVTNYADLATLRQALERLPCCAADARGATQGDPLNVVFVGEIADIRGAMARRDYRRDTRADDMAQQVSGRPPDAVLRKQAQAGAPSNWIRAWLAPISFKGRSIYVVQAGRPVGGRFARPDASDVVLDDDVDEARNLITQDMTYSGSLERLGFVTGVGKTSETKPDNALHGGRYYTDGRRAVLFFSKRPLSLKDVEFLHWEPSLRGHEAGASDRGVK
jgi:hypothetical protein